MSFLIDLAAVKVEDDKYSVIALGAFQSLNFLKKINPKYKDFIKGVHDAALKGKQYFATKEQLRTAPVDCVVVLTRKVARTMNERSPLSYHTIKMDEPNGFIKIIPMKKS